MTHPANTPERDEAIRKLASKFSEVAGGQPLDISVAAAALFIVAQADHAGSTEFNQYVREKLQQVVDLYTPPDGATAGTNKYFVKEPEKDPGYFSPVGVWSPGVEPKK